MSCFGCHGKLVEPKACIRCKTALYCSKDCQVEHWHAHHKNVCGKVGSIQPVGLKITATSLKRVGGKGGDKGGGKGGKGGDKGDGDGGGKGDGDGGGKGGGDDDDGDKGDDDDGDKGDDDDDDKPVIEGFNADEQKAASDKRKDADSLYTGKLRRLAGFFNEPQGNGKPYARRFFLNMFAVYNINYQKFDRLYQDALVKEAIALSVWAVTGSREPRKSYDDIIQDTNLRDRIIGQFVESVTGTSGEDGGPKGREISFWTEMRRRLEIILQSMRAKFVTGIELNSSYVEGTVDPKPFDQIEISPAKEDWLARIARQLIKLANFIGLGEVKRNVYLLISQFMATPAAFAGRDQHLVFYGQPGTGKTEIAKIIAPLFYVLGFTTIEPTDLTVLTKGDFTAPFGGQTVHLVKMRFVQNLGGTMFLDEAYSIVSGDQDSTGFDAITAINSFLTDFQGSVVMIMAGQEELFEEKLFSIQPGLQRRLRPWTFAAYGPEDLYRIFFLMTGFKDATVDDKPEAKDTLYQGIYALWRKGAFFESNGGGVNVILDSAIQVQSETLLDDPARLSEKQDVILSAGDLFKSLEMYGLSMGLELKSVDDKVPPNIPFMREPARQEPPYTLIVIGSQIMPTPAPQRRTVTASRRIGTPSLAERPTRINAAELTQIMANTPPTLGSELAYDDENDLLRRVKEIDGEHIPTLLERRAKLTELKEKWSDIYEEVLEEWRETAEDNPAKESLGREKLLILREIKKIDDPRGAGALFKTDASINEQWGNRGTISDVLFREFNVTVPRLAGVRLQHLPVSSYDSSDSERSPTESPPRKFQRTGSGDYSEEEEFSSVSPGEGDGDAVAVVPRSLIFTPGSNRTSPRIKPRDGSLTPMRDLRRSPRFKK